MKTIKVVAAVICDSFENKTKILFSKESHITAATTLYVILLKIKPRFLPLPEDMVNSRDNGSFPEERLKLEKHRSKP